MASSVLEEFMQTVVIGNVKKADINALHVKLDEVLTGLRGSGDEGDALRRDEPSVNVTHSDWDPSSDATMSDEDQPFASQEHCASRSSSVISAVLTPKMSSMNDPSSGKAKPPLPPGAKVLDVDDLATYLSFHVPGYLHVADVIQWTSSNPGIEDGSSLREAWKAFYFDMLDLQHRALKLQFPTTSLPTATQSDHEQMMNLTLNDFEPEINHAVLAMGRASHQAHSASSEIRRYADELEVSKEKCDRLRSSLVEARLEIDQLKAGEVKVTSCKAWSG
ncbi:hypothetical protein B9Z65_8955 [Elsinoe australis]|uniref:Uncharacterized protein n=1 Tax=Elsinoe australis TaxID=40998 RepID=A0A2P7ZYW4_9PEZI|nr:hypothetical protein B9Z65_8955 [Elsinoe australis]